MMMVDSSVWIDYFNGISTDASDYLDAAYSGERERSFWCIVNAFTPLSITSFNF